MTTMERVRKTSEVFDAERAEAVDSLSMKVFGQRPRRVAFPGGRHRSAFVVDMEEGLFVFARRESRDDAQLEGIILKCLGKTGYAPGLRAVVEDWVVQECMPGTRLPVLVDGMDSMEDREKAISDALLSLVHLQETAMSEGLHHRVPKIGTLDNWAWNRTGAPKRVSMDIGIQEPQIDREKIAKMLDVKRTDFIKWDARGGNALMHEGRMVWFDWEECGRSRALDDLAYLLADEWTNINCETEERLIAQFLPLFNRSLSTDEAEHYLRVFGTVHIGIRLRLALKYRVRDKKWWDRRTCISGDKVGVTPQEVSRLCARGRHWASKIPELIPLVPWLIEVEEYFHLPESDYLAGSERVN